MQALNKYWLIFSAAPHRLFFFAGALQAVLALLWWLSDLGGRLAGLYPPFHWQIPAQDAHGFLMIYGFFSFFIFGFLMTTYPRWMQGEQVGRHLYSWAFSLLFSGISLFYVGLMSNIWWLKAGLLIFVAGWTLALYALLHVYVKAKHPDKRHATVTSVMLLLAWLMIIGFISGQVQLVQLSKIGGIWLFLLPVFFAVSHRMLPFFSANVIVNYKLIRPYWALAWILILATAHGALEFFDFLAWLWLVDLPMAGIGIYLTLKWQFSKSLSVPLLAMMHIAFAWFGIAMLLYSLQSLSLFIFDNYILAKAPLHALVIGYFSSMLLAMVTRVTLGHSGRPLVVDRLSWALFLVFQLVPIIRITADLPWLQYTNTSTCYLVAGLVWLSCFGCWVVKYTPIYLRPRADGQRG